MNTPTPRWATWIVVGVLLFLVALAGVGLWTILAPAVCP